MPLFLQVSAVIKGPFGDGDLGQRDHAGDFHGLPGEEVGQHPRRGDGDAARGGPPLFSVRAQRGDIHPGHCAPDSFLAQVIDPQGRGFARVPRSVTMSGLIAENCTQVVRGKRGCAQCQVRPPGQDNKQAQQDVRKRAQRMASAAAPSATVSKRNGENETNLPPRTPAT